MRERFFDWLARSSANHPWRFMLVAFVVFMGSAGATTLLVPKLTFMDLLPEDEPKVAEYVEILDNYGNTEVVLVSLEGPDPDELLEFAGKFEERVLELKTAEGEPFFERVLYREDIEFMTDHGLMLAEADDLDQMLDNGLLDEPGLASVVGGYNRMFKAEYVDDSGDDESPESQERGAVRMIDSMWALPQTLRWHLEHPDATEEERRAEIEEAVQRFTVGDATLFSDDKSMLLLMVHPTYSTDEFDYSLPGVQYQRDVLEELLLEYPAIADNYAGPWETTGMWEMFTGSIEDQAELDSMRLQVPYKVPAIAPHDKLDSGTGMTGMQVVVDDETMTMYHDLGWNMVLAFVVVLVLFIVTFRMWTSPVIAMIVLAMSITMALGVNALAMGELTMMAMMFPVILLGLGVDYFVHILGEFTQRRGEGDDIETALKYTLMKTGRGILTGGLTTAIAFLALALTTFKGFTDFGLSAGLGVLCTLLTSFLVLPAALVIIHRFQDRRAAKKGVKKEPKQVIQFKFLALIGSASYRYWPVTLVVVAALTIFLGKQAANVGYATNMFDVEAKNLASIELNDVLEERFYLQPDSLVVSANSLEESWALTDGLDDLATVNMVDSISYVLPPTGEQEERAERIEEIRGRIEEWGDAPAFAGSDEEKDGDDGTASAERVDAFLKALYQMDCNIITIKKSAYMAGQDRLYNKAGAIIKEGESCVARVEGQPRPAGGWPRIAASEDMKAIAAFAEANPDAIAGLLDEFQAVFQPKMKATYVRMANPETITLETLPQEIRDRYQSTDGSQFLVTAYASGDVWEKEFQERIFTEVETVSDRVTGMPPLFVATIERGAAEGKNATLYALLAITILLLLDFVLLSGGRVVPGIASALLALVPLVIGTIWTVGCMTLLKIDINVANIIAIPLILGIGIDNGVHVIHRYRLEGEGKIGTVLSTVGRSIMLTSLTTIAAFGTFAFGLYRGLSTMGVILGIGIAICFLLSAFLLPALFRPLEKMGIKL